MGAAVAAEGDEFVFRGEPSLFLQGTISRLHPRQGSPGILKGAVYVAVLISRIGIHIGRYLQAARGVSHNRPVAWMKRLQHVPDRNGAAAARAHSVPRSQTLLPFLYFSEIKCLLFHRFSPFFLQSENSEVFTAIPRSFQGTWFSFLESLYAF